MKQGKGQVDGRSWESFDKQWEKNQFPQWLSGKESTCNAWLGRSSGRGHDNPLQYSCLRNPMDRRAWWAIAHKVIKSRT